MSTSIFNAPGLHIALTMIAFLVFLISVYMSTDTVSKQEDFRHRRGFVIHSVLSGVLLIVNAADLLPAILDSGLIASMIVWLVLFKTEHSKWRKRNLSRSALKEALDNLPIGLCFYTDNGQIMLTNNIIQTLSNEMIGSDLWNPDKLLSAIAANNPYITKAGLVYMFDNVKLDDGINQLSAFDVTDTYNLMTELTEENKKLEEMNSHMREYNMMVDQTIKKEEQLDTRIRIHDDLGRILLSTKVYLKRNDDFISRDDLLSKWNQTLHLLRGESLYNRNNDSMQVLQDAAAQVGITLKFVGTMPTDNRFLHIIISGGRECITNSAHADATELTVYITDDDDCYIITYTDNGREPDYPIHEGGGLSSLRQIVEKEGVRMETASSGRYFLRLIIPKEV